MGEEQQGWAGPTGVGEEQDRMQEDDKAYRLVDLKTVHALMCWGCRFDVDVGVLILHDLIIITHWTIDRQFVLLHQWNMVQILSWFLCLSLVG